MLIINIEWLLSVSSTSTSRHLFFSWLKSNLVKCKLKVIFKGEKKLS